MRHWEKDPTDENNQRIQSNEYNSLFSFMGTSITSVILPPAMEYNRIVAGQNKIIKTKKATHDNNCDYDGDGEEQ